MSQLPYDLVRSIAEHLHGDTYTLASLCLLDNQAFGLVLPLLYKTIHLSNVQSISGFCDVVIRSKRNLGVYTTSIRFSPENPLDGSQLDPVIEPIQYMLLKTPNLTDLVIDIATSRLGDLYQHLQLSPLPFSLHDLACHFAPNLITFLSVQPSIHTLTLYPPHNMLRNPGALQLPASVLPNLKSITGPTHVAAALLTGRPISHVDTTVIFKYAHREFCEYLKQSTAPEGVESLSVDLPKRKFWTDDLNFITLLAEACGTGLRELVLGKMERHHLHLAQVSLD